MKTYDGQMLDKTITCCGRTTSVISHSCGFLMIWWHCYFICHGNSAINNLVISQHRLNINSAQYASV